jgi:hypothetical protein
MKTKLRARLSLNAVLLPSLLLSLVATTAGCDSNQSPEAADATLSSAIAAEGVSTADQAVAAAVSWVKAADTQARTALEGGLAGGSGADQGLFVYAYAAGGQGGCTDSLQDLREPLLPFPVTWQEDTYYLDTTHFSVGAIGGRQALGWQRGWRISRRAWNPRKRTGTGLRRNWGCTLPS